MIAGALTYTLSDDRSHKHSTIESIFDQLCSRKYQPLAAIPHDIRQVYKDKGLRLIQQSITQRHAQSIAHCEDTGQVCISWSRLDSSEQLLSLTLAQGHSANNDASFILASYKKWLTNCPKHINGDFVFAIYDPQKQQLLLARDRLGVRPIYYCQDNHCFVFSSNPAAIAKLDYIDNQVSTDWIAQHLFKHYSDSNSTAFANIKKLPPGHTLLLRQELTSPATDIRPYWRLEDLLNKEVDAPSNNIIKAYRNHFDQAVAKRIQSDNPIGIELSGGLDSSSIMASLMEQSASDEVHCFSRAYFSLEMPPINALYKQYPNTQNHLWDNPNTTTSNYQNDLQNYIELFGLPDEHSLAIGSSEFLRTCERHNVKTLLSGYGGDEFSSSHGHDVLRQLCVERKYLSLLLRLQGKPIARLKQLYRLVFRQANNQVYKPSMLCNDHSDILTVQQRVDEYQRNLQLEPSHSHRIIAKWRLRGSLRLDSHTLAGSAKGVSFQWPFLDEKVLESYLTSPITERFGSNGKTRWLHRRAFMNRLPKLIIDKNDKNIGPLTNGVDVFELFMQRFPNEIVLHSALEPMIDTKALNRFLSSPKEEQRQQPSYQHTVKSIYSINLWLQSYF